MRSSRGHFLFDILRVKPSISPPLKVTPLQICALSGVSLALAWAVFRDGGVWPADWQVTLLVLGCLSVTYWIGRSRATIPPAGAKRSQNLLLLLLPVYVCLQLIPLPVKVLQVLSPARAALIQPINAVVHFSSAAPLSVNPPATLALLFSVLGYLGTFLLIRDLARQFAARPWIPAIPLLVIGGAEAVMGLFQAFAGPSTAGATGTYANRDHFSGFLEMLFPVAVLCGLSAIRSKTLGRSTAMWASSSFWLVAILLLLGIAYSLCRMGLFVTLGVVIAMGLLAWRPRRTSQRWLSIIVVSTGLLVVVLLSPAQLVDRFANTTVTDRASDDSRVGIWKDTLPLVRDYPLFGCGLGGFGSVFTKHQTIAPDYGVAFAHNDYLQALAEMGIVGFIILLVALASIVFPTFRGAFQVASENRRLLAVACSSAWCAILLHSLVDFNLYIPANAMTLAWIAGMGSGHGLRELAGR